MAVDVSKLRTPKEGAEPDGQRPTHGPRGCLSGGIREECELESDARDDPNDPLVRDFWVTVAAYEQLLSEKNERRTAASRTRQKVSRDGILATVQSWARKREPTMGFELLAQAGQWKLTGEYLVLKHAQRFDELTLRSHGRA